MKQFHSRKTTIPAAILAVLMCLCLCLFSACNNSGSEDTGTGADTGSGTQTTPEGAPIYTIVRSDSGNSEETAGAVKLRNTLREKYGI